MKEDEQEKEKALQKKENNDFAGDDAPQTPPNSNEHILTTLQRKHNAYRPEPKQYKRYQLPDQQKQVQQFKQFAPFQLKDSPAYQKSQGGLPEEVQAKMENSMGHDFSDVNIHKDSQNATDAGALAYAQGNDVHFAPGQFKPDTTSGQELIGHELAHVVQQREGRVKPTKVLGKGMAVNDDPGLEKEADDMGKKAAQAKVGPGTESEKSVKPADSPIIQKQEVSPEATKHETSDDMYAGKGWNDINDIGIIYQETGAYIRNKPLPGESSTVMKTLKQNQKVHILRHNPTSKWYAVTTDDGFVGYIADWLIWRNLPEPNAEIKKIPSGVSAIGLAETHYGHAFKEWGSDLRFVVNALAYANNMGDRNGTGTPGIHKPNGNNESWAKTEVTSDVFIWLPSVAFMNSLKGKVSSGSISHGMWEGVKAVGKGLAFGASFIGGILHGAFDGLVAIVKGIIDLVWGAIKSIFTGNIWQDLQKIFAAVISMTLDDWEDVFLGWMDPWLEKTESDNPFTSGHAYGYIAGRILFEVVSLFVGGVAVVKGLSKLGKLAGKLSKITGKIGSGISKATGKVREGLDMLKAMVLKGISVNYHKVLASASVAYKGSTKLGHSLSKHAGRHPNTWGRLTGNPSTWHNQALRHFDDIMEASGDFIEVTTPNGIRFLEKRLPDGRGLRLNMDQTFKGFID